MRYRVQHKIVATGPNGVDYHLDPARDYDDEDPADAEVIAMFRGHFSSPNVEAASAAPGERRNVKRR